MLMKKVLITGCGSFTAGHLMPFLLQQKGLSLTGTDREQVTSGIEFIKADLTGRTETEALLRNVRPDLIINLAGLNKSDRIYSFFDLNLTIARNILESLLYLSMHDCKTLLISSSAVYGNVVQDPVNESCPANPVNAYGFSKLAMEHMAMDLFNKYNLPVFLVRPFNLYGTGQQKTFVIPAFINSLLKVKYEGERGLNTGDLESERDFLHVSDAVKAYWLILQSGTPGKAYNLGTGHVIKIHDILMKIIDILGLDRHIDIVKQSGCGSQVKTITADITGITQLGWAPVADMDASLREIVRYEMTHAGYKN